MADVMKAASARHADFEGRHAPDIPDDILWQYVVEADFVWQSILYVLYVAGLRAKAIRYFRRNRIYVPKKRMWKKESLEFVVRIDKTRKRRALRAILQLPKEWDWIPQPPTDQTWQFFAEGDAEERLFEGVTASDINSELRKMSARLNLPRPTTYSFRRAYINRIIPLVNNKKQLTEFTLHFETSTVDAFYMRTRADKNKME